MNTFQVNVVDKNYILVFICWSCRVIFHFPNPLIYAKNLRYNSILISSVHRWLCTIQLHSRARWEVLCLDPVNILQGPLLLYTTHTLFPEYILATSSHALQPYIDNEASTIICRQRHSLNEEQHIFTTLPHREKSSASFIRR